MTAQIIAFKLSDYIYAIIFIGFIISFVVKSERAKNIGQTIFAFGLLFLGIETMGSVMKPLASSPIFTDMIEQVSHIPVLGVAVGTLMTLVVQSKESATIAVLQNFAEQPDRTASAVSWVLSEQSQFCLVITSEPRLQLCLQVSDRPKMQNEPHLHTAFLTFPVAFYLSGS